MRRPARYRTLVLGFVLSATSLGPVLAQAPCDFKGVSVGDKMTREQVMGRLGIKNFKTDPPSSSFEQMQSQIEKYGITGAAEIEDDKIGPYCRQDYCNIPLGISVGDDHIPVKVFVALKNDTVTEIEVSFNYIFWNDVFPIITRKYNSPWDIENQAMPVMDYQTKKIEQFEGIIATNKSGGINLSTKDTCSLSATSIDIIFRHHDSLGTLHSMFVIKRDSKEF